MRGCKRYIALAMLLFFAGSIAVSAQNDTNICEDAALENESAGWPSFTFVQEAANGTFVKNEDGNYTLTLYNVVPYTTYFSDPPRSRLRDSHPWRDSLQASTGDVPMLLCRSRVVGEGY